MPDDVERLLTVLQVAKRLGVSVEAVLRWIDTRKIRATNRSSTRKRPVWRISESDLARFVEQLAGREG